MRELIVNESITVDGVIETGEWFSPRGSRKNDLSDVEAAIKEQREAADAFLVGRRTFEDMREFWPRQTDDTTGTRVYLDEVHKYVISRSMGDPPRVDYGLTQVGQTLSTQVRTLIDWAEYHREYIGTSRLRYDLTAQPPTAPPRP